MVRTAAKAVIIIFTNNIFQKLHLKIFVYVKQADYFLYNIYEFYKFVNFYSPSKIM